MKKHIGRLLLSLVLCLSLLPTTAWADGYTVNYGYDNGTAKEGAVFDTTPDDRGNITLPSQDALTKEGYTLVGWSDGMNEYLPGASYHVEQNVSLTALWTEKNPDTLEKVFIAEKQLISGYYYHNGTAGAAGRVNGSATDANAMYVDGVLVLSGLNVNSNQKGIRWEYKDLIIVLLHGNTNTVVNTADTAINGEMGGGRDTPDLIVRGDGLLNVTGKTYGIWAWQDITFDDGAQVSVTAEEKSAVLQNWAGKITVKNTAGLTAYGKEYGVGTDGGNKGSLIVESGAAFTAKGESGALRNIENDKADFKNQTVYVGNNIAGTNLRAWDNTAALMEYKYISLSRGTHEHNYGYTLSTDKSTITATCTIEDCPNTSGGSIKLSAPADLIYSGNEKSVSMTNTTSVDSQSLSIVYKNGDVTLDGAPTDVGTYTAYLTYGGVTAQVTFTIEPKTVTANSTNITLSGNMTYKPDGVKPSVTVKDDNGNVIPAAEYTVTYTNNTAVGTATVNITDNDGGNYNVSGSKTFEITKASANLNINPVNAVYDGEALEIGEGKDVTYSANIAGTLSWKDGNAPKNVADSSSDDKVWKVVFTPADTTNYNPSERTVNVIISPASLTIRVDAKSAYVGNAKPALTYQVIGLCGEDALTTVPTLTCDADMNAAGTYPISASGAVASSNYVIDYIPSELTVSAKHHSSSGSSSSEYTITAENGANGGITISPKKASKGDTVTITVTPDKGYDLETLTVLDKNGEKIQLVAKGNGKYTFKMPDSKVTVKATFAEDNSMLNFFVDVNSGDYYFDAVMWAAENGITGGVTETAFGPHLSCTRAQLVTFLWRVAGSPVVNYAMDFADVDANAYYGDAIRWAASLGIVDGYGNALFGSGDTITREQMAVILYRFAQAMNMDTTQGGMAVREFADYESISGYAVDAMQWAVNAGIMQGYNNNLMPGQSCTRAQIVTMLYRLLGE